MNGIPCETFKRRVIYVAGEGYWLGECVTMPSHVMSMLDDFVRHFSLGGPIDPRRQLLLTEQEPVRLGLQNRGLAAGRSFSYVLG